MAHAEVAEERRRYQHLFQYAPDAYLLTDLAGIIREANHSAAHLLGVQPRFLVGKTLVSFVAAEDRPRLRAEIGRWRSEPAAKSLELRLQPRGGEPFDASLTLSVARGGPRDKAFGFRWLVRDISAQRQLTDELRLREEEARREAEASEARAYHVQKLESIGVLAGGIAHDFNNLLHVVLGNADLARLHVPAESPAREHLDEVVRATQRAAELTQQLLAYSGRGAVESRQLDLSREVREMAHPAPDRDLQAGHARVGSRARAARRHRRSHPAPADRDEPHHQRLRRPRRGTRHHHAAHRACVEDRRGRRGGADLGVPRGDRHRMRHGQRHAPAHLRPVLLDQVHRPRARDWRR